MASRIRTTVEYDNTTPHWWQPRDRDGVPRGSPTNYPSRNYAIKEIIDEKTPGYWEKLRRGEFLPINPVTISRVTLEQVATSGSNSLKVTKTPPAVSIENGECFVIGARPSLPGVAIDPATVDNVVINAIAKAKTSDFDVLTFLGEFKDTVKLFRTTVNGVAHISRRVALRAKRRVDRRILRKHIAELRRRGITWKGKKLPTPPRLATSIEYVTEFNRLWLTARYGLRPLVYDFQSISSLLHEKRANLIARKSATLRRSLNGTATNSVVYSSIRYDDVLTRTGSQTYRATVFYKDNQSRFGANPVITAYELTRMSFVFDWFINVGAWLQAMSPREGYQELGISVGVVTDYNDVVVSTPSEGSGHGWNIGQGPCRETYTVLEYERFKYSGIPLPSINVNLNPLKVMDLVALVVTNRDSIFKILGLK